MVALLPTPVGRQKEVLALPAHGHTVVLGTAGSGKTTLAVHRALYLAHPDTDHSGRTLLVTFNRTLVEYLSSLFSSVPGNVDVRTYHRFARGYLDSRGRMSPNVICGPEDLKELCCQAIEEARSEGESHAMLQRPIAFLTEEFRWLAQHGITTADQYVKADRIRRAGTRDRPERTAQSSSICINAINCYGRSVARLYDWDDLSHTVLAEFESDKKPRHFRACGD